ncbi:Uncharacterised protein, partial [Mycoplasmopsis synoviae]
MKNPRNAKADTDKIIEGIEATKLFAIFPTIAGRACLKISLILEAPTNLEAWIKSESLTVIIYSLVIPTLPGHPTTIKVIAKVRSEVPNIDEAIKSQISVGGEVIILIILIAIVSKSDPAW